MTSMKINESLRENRSSNLSKIDVYGRELEYNI